MKENDGWTALMRASCNGHTEIVSLLLDRGADFNLKNNIGETALMFASSEGHENIVSCLHSSICDRRHVSL